MQRRLDYFRHANIAPDARLAEAIEVLESKRDEDGRFPLETFYPGNMSVDFHENVGQSSRWITLRALRVLKWYDS